VPFLYCYRELGNGIPWPSSLCFMKLMYKYLNEDGVNGNEPTTTALPICSRTLPSYRKISNEAGQAGFLL